METKELKENQAFIFGKKEAAPEEKSVAGFKAASCLRILKNVRGSILEVGCGGGQFLRMLRRHRPDLTIYGVDVDPTAVLYASKNEELAITCASVENLPFDPEMFSAVVGVDILEHVENPSQAIKEVYRVLKKGGSGFFYVPCEGNEGCIYKRLGHHDRKKRQIGHIQQFTADEVIRLFEEANFTIKRVRYTDYFIGQIFDYLFFRQLERASDPDALWAAQGLEVKKGDCRSYVLYYTRILVSAITWCEWMLRKSKRGSMGVILTVEKS
jgi:2-polyprenyl-3-methyl-5-hydroxy-6-metoxy-1,4-benzoquinol methylase